MDEQLSSVFRGIDNLPSACTPPPTPPSVTSALIVLDTNALLLPYSASTNSLTQIERALLALKSEQRLAIPAQVLREYKKNRPARIGELFKLLGDVMSEHPPQVATSPLLASIPEYQAVLQADQRLKTLLLERRKALEAVRTRVREWAWSDPVRDVYTKVLTPDLILEPKWEQGAFDRVRAERYAKRLPPGYKDAGKEDGGSGDLVIWFSILGAASQRRQDVIFVSADEKSDWHHQAAGVPLFPRIELLEEFHHASGGKAFGIMRLSQLLESLSAPLETVSEIRKSESTETKVADRIDIARLASIIDRCFDAAVDLRVPPHFQVRFLAQGKRLRGFLLNLASARFRLGTPELQSADACIAVATSTLSRSLEDTEQCDEAEACLNLLVASLDEALTAVAGAL